MSILMTQSEYPLVHDPTQSVSSLPLFCFTLDAKNIK